MPDSTDLKPVLDFLSRLQENNDRTWFNENRAAYEDARARFETVVDQLLDGLRPFEDLGDLKAQDCVKREDVKPDGGERVCVLVRILWRSEKRKT